MKSMASRPTVAVVIIRLAVRAALIFVGFFWTPFAVAEVGMDGERAWLHAMQFTGLIIALVALAVWRPRWGGVGLILGGVYAAWFFRHPFVEATLAAPAILAGLALLVWG